MQASSSRARPWPGRDQPRLRQRQFPAATAMRSAKRGRTDRALPAGRRRPRMASLTSLCLYATEDISRFAHIGTVIIIGGDSDFMPLCSEDQGRRPHAHWHRQPQTSVATGAEKVARVPRPLMLVEAPPPRKSRRPAKRRRRARPPAPIDPASKCSSAPSSAARGNQGRGWAQLEGRTLHSIKCLNRKPSTRRTKATPTRRDGEGDSRRRGRDQEGQVRSPASISRIAETG